VVQLLDPVAYLGRQTFDQLQSPPRVVIAAEAIPQQPLLDAIFDDLLGTFHIEVGVEELPVVLGLLLPRLPALPAGGDLALRILGGPPPAQHRLREQGIHAVGGAHRCGYPADGNRRN